MAAYAMVGLTQFRHASVVTYQKGSPLFRVGGIVLPVIREIAFIYAFVIVREDGRDIEPVRTRHTVVAFVARDGLKVDDVRGDAHKEFVLLSAYRLQRGVGGGILYQMLHIGHSAEYAKHPVRCAGETEGPAGYAFLRLPLLQFGCDVLRHFREPASQERFHYGGGNAPFVQFFVQIRRVGVTIVDFLRVIPVQIIEFYLCEIPMVLSFVVPLEGEIEDGHVAVV